MMIMNEEGLPELGSVPQLAVIVSVIGKAFWCVRCEECHGSIANFVDDEMSRE